MTMQDPSGRRGFGIYRAPDNTGRGGARTAVMRSPVNPYPPTQIRLEITTALASAYRPTSDGERRQNIHTDRRGCRKAFGAGPGRSRSPRDRRLGASRPSSR